MYLIRCCTGKYWMDNLYCTGGEPELSDCRFEGWGKHDCDASEAAGVICSDKQTESKKKLVKLKSNRIHPMHHKHLKLEVRLNGGRILTEGRVEVRV